METTLTLKLRGIEAKMLDAMINSGLFNTQSEAIRAALVNYSIQAGYLNRKDVWKEIQKHTARRVSDSDLMKDISKIKNEA